MKTIKKIGLVSAVAFAMLAFAACDDSSSASSDETSVSSSSVESSDSESSSAVDKKSSGEEANEKDKSSSSVKDTDLGEVSSSSAKETKISSSDEILSSSSSVSRRCEEDALDTVKTDTSTAYMRCINNRWRTDSIVYVPKPKEYPVMDSLFATEYEPVYSKFEDPRDHQVYKTTILHLRGSDGRLVDDVLIEVFAQNLNYGEMIDTSIKIHDDAKVEKYCDLNDEWFCNNGWGGRYTWSEAMALPAKYDSVLWKDTVGGDTRIHQGICPDKWHIMNAYEWKNFTSSAGEDLASKVNWKLNKRYVNSTGMSVLFQMKTYKENWGNATFFLPAEEDGKKMYRVTVNDSYVTQNAAAIKHHNWFYVRCVRDY
ncbi:FISUMP domain-containing protein [Fibrobacter sp.]|uniref:FISUMP domain-containing protein n=1 Tax=Fibrobacter sp. TaxID=35828 RepID=UPI00262ED00B|nr:FISUMP domain-containing protein [Fibrobacter sp.]MDD5942646.1 FISUMP domain-containing protein [Fibrobacter sp.]